MRSRLRASCQASSVSWSLGARVSVKHTSYELHEIRFTVRGCCFRTIPSIVKALIPNRVTVGVDAVHRAGLVGKHIRILIKFKQYVTLFFSDVFSAEMLLHPLAKLSRLTGSRVEGHRFYATSLQSKQ